MSTSRSAETDVSRAQKWSRVRFIAPGLLVIALLQLWPTLVTLAVSVTNYGGDHVNSRSAAIAVAVRDSLRPVDGGTRYRLTPAVRSGDSPVDGPLELLLTDADGAASVVDAAGRRELPADQVSLVPGGPVTAAEGFHVLSSVEIEERGTVVGTRFLVSPDAGVVATSAFEAMEAKPILVYEADRDRVVDTTTGRIFVPQEGQLRSLDGQRLAVGWFEGVGMNNYAALLTDPVLRSGVLTSGLFTVAFATLSVGIAFVAGLLIAVAVEDRSLAGHDAYLTLTTLPYAVPIVVGALLARGVLGDALDNVWVARAAVIVVNVWLLTPLMTMMSLRAVRSVPTGVRAASRIDGATPVEVLRHIIGPWVIARCFPMLVATLAVQLNNFPLVWVLTRGGPLPEEPRSAGGTDLLITYAYRLAFGSGSTGYGVAAAVSMVTLVLTAAVAAWAYRGTRVFAELLDLPARAEAERGAFVAREGDRPQDRWARELHFEPVVSGRLHRVRHAIGIAAVVLGLGPVVFLLAQAVAGGGAVGPSLGTLGKAYVVSVSVAVLAATIVTAVAGPAAYALSHLRLRFRRTMLAVFFVAGLLPTVPVVIGMVVVIRAVGGAVPALGAGSLLGLVLAYVGTRTSWAVWLVKTYLDTVPREVGEAAQLDGASPTRSWLVVAREVRPTLASAWWLTFLFCFGEILLASVLVADSSMATLPVVLDDIAQVAPGYSVVAAASALMVAPLIVAQLVLRDRLVGLQALRPLR